ncbi:tubulin-tyrosine ligase [Schizosaccharomyces japonicus yFS275]|uniref:Tubulin-tyrosine ligase n=1 Tax=Schizosaccharomyces japonicus (strain yFS275 / FY16936) TaxID=402676 RepID=B6JZ72_SCHJY|nr:tubulin-tyrosine ligase [Schizosaccharomyces japonicus yFS275]EEB06840.1 tubulin-tyrosine ligase [Schizosaccharomyces japonicus yFS275]
MSLKVYLDYQDPYVEPKIKSAIQRYYPSSQFVSDGKDADLQWAQYELLDFDAALANSSSLLCSYVIRKALIRKQYLWHSVLSYTTKHPDSILKKVIPETFTLELDYAEFLDDALMESYELRQELEMNEARPANERDWYILKPSMCDRAQGIRLFSTIDELQAIFDSFDEESEDEENTEENDSTGNKKLGKIVINQIRNFIAQKYIKAPLLLNNKKFHIRAYVVAFGSLKVYVNKEMLCLFAQNDYVKPTSDTNVLLSHLTNTCIQEAGRSHSVQAFWDSEVPNKDDIFKKILLVVGEVFEAAAVTQSLHFQTLDNAFEIFGVDLLISSDQTVSLLEVNAYPDFRQTGDQLSGVIERLFLSVMKTIVCPFFQTHGHETITTSEDKNEENTLVLCRDLQTRGAW